MRQILLAPEEGGRLNQTSCNWAESGLCGSFYQTHCTPGFTSVESLHPFSEAQNLGMGDILRFQALRVSSHFPSLKESLSILLQQEQALICCCPASGRSLRCPRNLPQPLHIPQPPAGGGHVLAAVPGRWGVGTLPSCSAPLPWCCYHLVKGTWVQPPITRRCTEKRARGERTHRLSSSRKGWCLPGIPFSWFPCVPSSRLRLSTAVTTSLM